MLEENYGTVTQTTRDMKKTLLRNENIVKVIMLWSYLKKKTNNVLDDPIIYNN